MSRPDQEEGEESLKRKKRRRLLLLQTHRAGGRGVTGMRTAANRSIRGGLIITGSLFLRSWVRKRKRFVWYVSLNLKNQSKLKSIHAPTNFVSSASRNGPPSQRILAPYARLSLLRLPTRIHWELQRRLRWTTGLRINSTLTESVITAGERMIWLHLWGVESAGFLDLIHCV